MRKPEHLNKRAYGYYERLEKILNGKLKEGDENLLAVLANCYVFYNDYQEDLMARPAVQAGESRTYKNPLHGMIKDREAKIIEISKQFGLSPGARGDRMDKEPDKPDALDKI